MRIIKSCSHLIWYSIVSLILIQLWLIYKWNWFCSDFEPHYHVHKLSFAISMNTQELPKCVQENAKKASESLLAFKTKQRYKKEYETFKIWQSKYKIAAVNKIVLLAYFQELCELYKKGASEGTLCSPLCENKEVFAFSCQAYHTIKKAVFKATWGDIKLIFKLVDTAIPSLHWFDNGELKYPSEKEFLSTVRAVAKSMLNQTLSQDTINRLAHFTPNHRDVNLKKRQSEMDNIWALIQDNEYLFSRAYSNRDVFPQVLGTCGPYFAVEYIEPMPEPFSILYDKDTRINWSQNLKYSILIMELLDELDNNFKEPLHLCDVKLHDFGVTHPENGRAKILDLDTIYPRSVVNKFLKNIGSCQQDGECRIFDCRGRCNKAGRCDGAVSNNNLQIVCEKIFLGWRMSNRVLLPGLLLSQYAPAELISVVRQCANPANEIGVPRAGAHEDLRRQLYGILIDVEQALNIDPYL